MFSKAASSNRLDWRSEPFLLLEPADVTCVYRKPYPY